MGRLKIELMPPEYPKAKKVLDGMFRSLREVLDRGFRMREQVAGIVDTVIDTAEFPVTIEVPGVKSPPIAVQLLSAIKQRSTTSRVLSGGTVDWEWRSGYLVIHDISGLAATTRYDAVLAVFE